MRLIVQVQGCQSECMDPRPLCRISTRQMELLAEIGENGGCLADDEALPIFTLTMDAERRGRKGGGIAVRVVGRVVGFQSEDLMDAVFHGVGHVDIWSFGCFESEANEFTTTGWIW